MTDAAPADQLEDLILCRLLPDSASRPSPKVIWESMVPLFDPPIAKERVDDTLGKLRAKGLLVKKGQHLTDAGRERGLKYLGLTALPVKCNWTTILVKHFLLQKLGLQPWSETDAACVTTENKLAVLLLKQKYKLPIRSDASQKDLFEALVCQLVGFPDCTNFNQLSATIISCEAQCEPVLPVKDLRKVAPRLLLGTKRGGIDAMRAVVLKGMFRDGGNSEPAIGVPVGTTNEFSLGAFAARVLAAARSCPAGRFGDNKVFISHVWWALQLEPNIQPLGLDGFKAKLLEASRDHLLRLTRADLVQGMNPVDVKDSETTYLGIEFHFILLEE